MEEKSLVKYEAKDGQEISLSFDTIIKYLVQGRSEFVTRQEMMYFMGICKSRGLNPFAKDCYLIKYSQKEGAAIITAIDYFRKRAKAQRDCKGWKKGIIVERKGEIFHSDGLMLSDDVLLGGWFKAKPEGWDEPFLLEVNLKGYIKHKVDGSVTKFWSKENQPSQIAKVAESQGLRTLWPDEFQQLYTQEELGEGEMFKATEEVVKTDAASALNDKIKDSPKDEAKTDIYETKEPEKEEKKEEEKEDQIRKLYKGLGDQAFAEFVSSHAEAIPGMEQVYQDEIRGSWGKRAKKKGGLLEGKPYPLDAPKEEIPDKEPEKPEEEKPNLPITLNCPLSYEERQEKNDGGRVSVDVCDNVCESNEQKTGPKDTCVAYMNYQANIKG